MEKVRENNLKEDKIPMVAHNLIHVGIAGIDFYTFGHIIMGVAGFTILVTFLNTPSAFSFVQLGALFWDLFENLVLLKLGFKFEGRRDSPINSLFDILFIDIGASISFILYVILIEDIQLQENFFIVINLILAAIFYILFFVTKKKIIDKTIKEKYDEMFKEDEEVRENIYLAQIYSDLFQEKVENVKKKIKSKSIDYDLL